MSMTRTSVLGLTAVLLLSACGGQPLDWDLRSAGAGGLDTTDAARQATGPRPGADARGVISYPGYQVAVARKGDTVASVAARVGLQPAELAKYNALQPQDTLRDGEVLALPSRVAAAPAPLPGAGAVIGSGAAPGRVDVSSIATTALDRVETTAPAAAAAAPAKATTSGMEPTRHRVARGETAFSIARSYNVSAKALADWNGLGPDLAVREGQYLMIPTPTGAPPEPATEVTTAPGNGSPTPTPPSAKDPLPDEKVEPAATAKAKAEEPVADMSSQRTTGSKFAMPVSGKIIRSYAKGKNDGIDIAAAAGSSVKAAADGTVAAVTKDTTGTPIVVIRHADGILTVYAGVDGLQVGKGDSVKKGQTIAAVRAADPAFVHFEVRKGVDSLDPLPYIQ